MIQKLQGWYRASLRHQILIWLLATNLLLLLLMFGGSFEVSRSAVEKNISDQLEREHLIESEIFESYLNHLVNEVKALSLTPSLINALNSPGQANTTFEAVLGRNPLMQDDLASITLLDDTLNPVYSANQTVSPSKELVQKVLRKSQSIAELTRWNGDYFIQVAQPIGSRGVLIIGLSVDQMMDRFFQGRKDLSAWTLEDGSGQLLSYLPDSGQRKQNLAEMYGSNPQAYPVSNPDKEHSVWKTIKGPLRLVAPLADLHLQLVLQERTNWTKIIGAQLFGPYLGVLLLVIVLAFFVITFVGRGLASPLEELTAYALAVRKSHFSGFFNRSDLESLMQRSDEVGRLSVEFSQMLEGLQQGFIGLENKVAERNAQLEAIFELSPDGFIEINAQQQVSFVNPAFVSLTGISVAEVLGQSVEVLLNHLQKHANDISRAQLEKMFEPEEKMHWLQIQIPIARTLALLTKPNQHSGLLVYLHDVTQEAELEEMRSSFMSTAAHELRTPISSILGYAQLLGRRLRGDSKPSVEVIEDMSEVIERQSKNMAELVNDLLDLSKLEHQIAKGFDLHETAIAPYLRSIVSQFQMPGDARYIAMYIDDHLPEVRLHPDSFKRLIVNLLSNAFKYSPIGSPVAVKTFIENRERECVGIEIEDHGSGMSPEDLEHVFERFYRSSASAEIPGTGLGLAIAKEIMQAHGGEISITSEIAKGTKVRLLFPVSRKWGAN